MRLLVPVLLVLAFPAAAQPPAAAPVSEAVFQKLLSVLPDAQALKTPSHEADPQELAALTALNPGKEAEVRAILDAFEACVGPANDKALDRMLRHVANALGEAKVRTLTAFYESSDLERAGALFARIEAGETLPEPDQAEADALLARYPLAEFRDAMVPAGMALGEDSALMDTMMRCSMAREEALERASIRQNAY